MEVDRSTFPLTRVESALAITLVISLNPLKFFLYLLVLFLIYVLFFATAEELTSLFATMEAKAIELLAILKNSNASVDTKVSHMTALKSDIKQKNVPEAAVTPIFDSVKQAIASPHTSLSGAGFSALGHLLRRLGIQQQQHAVALQSRYLYPLLLERLGDHKERVRAQAAQAFTELWPAASADVEHHVLEVALTGKNPRAKEAAMIWLTTMTKQHGLLFKNHVGRLVACLEDADSGVRDTAKATVIELFQTAPPRAKSDLKKQLTLLNVRKSIATSILNSIGLGSSVDQETSAARPTSRLDPVRPASSFSHHRVREEISRPASVLSVLSVPRPESVLSTPSNCQCDTPTQTLPFKVSREHSRDTIPEPRPVMAKGELGRPAPLPKTLSQSRSMESLTTPAAPIESDGGEKIDPLYIHSHREVDEMAREMLPDFEGKETEQNWILREKHSMTLRRLTRGNAPHDYSQQYLAAIKTLLDGILRTANSLRTTLSTAGCLLVQDIARINGPGIDHMVEILMQNFIKMGANAKKIAAQNAKVTVDVIIAHVSYTLRILQHLWLACQDKNAQPRLYATAWLKTLITKQARHKSSVEHGGGLDLLEKCIKKGLADANPGVREGMRGTFWTFYTVWPERANDIMSDLDSKSKSLLEKDSANPNRGGSSLTTSDAPRSAFSKSTSAAASRPTLKEAIAAQKKARMAAESKATPEAKKAPPAAPTSSLSSAPMRPAMKPRRPDAPRPVTADPSHPARPKSRLDGAPITTAKTKPKRLDIFQATDNDTAADPADAETVKANITKHELETAKPTEDSQSHITGDSLEFSEEKLVLHGTTMVPASMVPATVDITKPDSDTVKDQVSTVPVKFDTPKPEPDTVKVYEDSQSNDLAKSFEFSEDKLLINDTPSPFLLRPERLQRLQNENQGFDHSNQSTPHRTFSSPLEERSLNDSSLRVSSLSSHAASNLTSNPTPRANRESWIKLEFAHRCKSISPRSKDPIRAREILEKGISKIKDNQLDVYGYRKIQGLIKLHESMFTNGEDTDHLYMLLLLALFSALETAPSSKLPSAMDIKVQVLVTIRVIYMFSRERFAPYYPAAMTALIKARRYYDATHYIVSGLEETAEDFIAESREGYRMLRAALDQIETEKRDREGLRAVTMGIWVVMMLLRDSTITKAAIPQPLLERVATFVRSNIADKDPEVRKGIMDLCVPLFGVFNDEDAFFKAVDANRQQKNLILYYVTTTR